MSEVGYIFGVGMIAACVTKLGLMIKKYANPEEIEIEQNVIWKHVQASQYARMLHLDFMYYAQINQLAYETIMECIERLLVLHTLINNENELQNTLKMCAQEEYRTQCSDYQRISYMSDDAMKGFRINCIHRWIQCVHTYQTHVHYHIEYNIKPNIAEFLSQKHMERQMWIEYHEQSVNHQRKNGSLPWISNAGVRAIGEAVIDVFDDPDKIKEAHRNVPKKYCDPQKEEPKLAIMIRRFLGQDHASLKDCIENIKIPREVPSVNQWLELEENIETYVEQLVKVIEIKLLQICTK